MSAKDLFKDSLVNPDFVEAPELVIQLNKTPVRRSTISKNCSFLKTADQLNKWVSEIRN